MQPVIDSSCVVQAKKEKWGKEGSVGTALGCFSEICRDFKEPQIVGSMLGNTGGQIPMSVSNVK